MNGEHSGPGEQGNNTTIDPAEQARLDEEARRRQDPANHPRMQAMAAIAEKHESDIEQQLAAEGLSSRVTHAEGETPSAAEEAQRARAAEEAERQRVLAEAGQTTDGAPRTTPAEGKPARRPAAAVDPQLLEQLGTEPLPMEAFDSLKVRVKIDGEEQVMTIFDLRRAAQLDGAASKRLQHANELLRQAQAAVAAGTSRQPPPVGVEGKSGAGDHSPASQDVTAAAEGLVDALFVGDKAAAVATVTQLLKGAQPAQQLDVAAAARQAIAEEKQKLSQEEAEAQFRSDFKDVVKDPILTSAADAFYEEVIAEDPQKSYAEALTEAGNRTRQWLASRTGTPATGPSHATPRQKKLEAKQGLDEPRGLSRTEVKVETPIPTHTDVIAQMRAARGLG